jgi:hypothetical protein
MTPNSPFLLSFIAGVFAAVVVGALLLVFVFVWRRYRDQHWIEPSSKDISLTTLEGGRRPRSTSDKLDSSTFSPSKLGGKSPSSAEKAVAAWEPPRQFSAKTGTINDAQNDAQSPLPVVSPSSVYIVYPVTTEVVDSGRVQNHSTRAKVILDSSTSENGNMDQSRSFIFPSSPMTPPLLSAPPKYDGRSSVSTVWSQESTWPRERLDFPMPPLAHFPGARTPRVVVFTPLMASFQDRRSTSSLPRSVGPSDFEEDF